MSRTENVRQLAKKLTAEQGDFASQEVGAALDLPGKKVTETLTFLRKRGELAREKRRWRYVGTKETELPVQVRQKLWRLFRGLREVTYEDLMTSTGAPLNTCRDFMAPLIAQGVARRLGTRPQRFRLIHDPVALPPDEAKMARLREIKLRKQQEGLAALDQAAASLEQATVAVAEARLAVSQMEEG